MPGMSSRKACTGCGAISTPQWREGPYGPRTLCNACGVRHLRRENGRPSDRKAQAKQARRKAHAAPTVRENKIAQSKAKHRSEGSAKPRQPGSKSNCSRRVKEQPQPSQQSVQEYYWESGSSSDAHHSSQPTIEDNAAANLLAMSKPTRCMDGTATHSHELEHQAQGSSYPAAEEYDPSSTLQACEQLESTEAELQAQFLSDLAAMREEVEAAEKKLAAANAAVDAVSQVLVSKQAAVTAAWAVMADANQRLQQHMKQEPDFDDAPCKRVNTF